MAAIRLVTISGLPGSGTSTLCKVLARRTGWTYVNAGQIFRDLAREAGVSLAEFGRRAETDGAIDCQLDERMMARALVGDACVLEGRITGWMVQRHGVPALKVWVQADLGVRAGRVAGRDGQTLAEATAAVLEREASERKRYLAHHGIDLSDLSVYDLVLDSNHATADALADRLVSALPGGPPEGEAR